MNEPLLEIIAFDINSCAKIEQWGGNRIELCANPLEGGTTVSHAMMAAARAAVSIPVFPIIRPRGGDFLYTGEEYALMRNDIRWAKECGMNGVVIGLLNPDKTVDYEKTAALVELAWPMEVTFHRAFDEITDYIPALETVIRAGCQRILTSGGKPAVMEGLQRLKHCVELAGDRITILPGSGIRAGNIREIHETLQTGEYHSSARHLSASGTYTLDVNELTALRAALSI